MATVTGKTSSEIDTLLGPTIIGANLDSAGALTFQRKNGGVIAAGSLGPAVVDATINGSKHLIFTTMGGQTIDAGSVDLSSPLDAYPVGAIYIGVTSANPATLLGGGTWARIAKGKMLVGVDEADVLFDAVKETGGSKTKVLAALNLPKHKHTINHGHTARGRPAIGGLNSVLAQGGGNATIETLNDAVNDFNGSSGDGPGDSEPFDVMNPYITAYIWERTA